MGSKRSPIERRCEKCKVHLLFCYCAGLEVLDLKTRVSIIMHKKEKWLPSNTAQLTQNSLTNFNLYHRGEIDSPLEVGFLEQQEYTPLYLYPTEDAVELTSDYLKQFSKPINLIVPDGTWRQAKKIHLREELLENILKVRITPPSPSQYKLRTQKYEFGLCTHEAISYAIGVIEGEKIKEILLQNLSVMVNANLKARRN